MHAIHPFPSARLTVGTVHVDDPDPLHPRHMEVPSNVRVLDKQLSMERASISTLIGINGLGTSCSLLSEPPKSPATAPQRRLKNEIAPIFLQGSTA
jgi:hypothetical protein